VDAQVNTKDTAGDEGELFSALVRGVNLSAAELGRIKAEDDHTVIVVNGQSIPVEKSTLIERVNLVSGTATQTSGTSFPWNDVSDNGRYVAFLSDATNLVTGDTNGQADIFVRDRTTGQTIRASVNSSNVEANSYSYYAPSISSTGQYVAFGSAASNLVANDTNGQFDIFVRDIVNNATTRVNVATGGLQANGSSGQVSISADGRYVVFESAATNLVANDTNGQTDIFVYDRNTAQTRLVSVGLGGTSSNSFSRISNSAISNDGRYIVFASAASNLVSGDTNNSEDIFVFDQTTGLVSRVSVGPSGVQSNSTDSMNPSISGDGRYVAFQSSSNNLVLNDTNNAQDIFVHDRTTGLTSRVSVTSSGAQVSNNGSTSVGPKLSNDGRYVAFSSYASGLVAGDTNGTWDVFVYDRTTGSIVRANTSSIGIEANGRSSDLAITGDGAYIVFASDATNLVSGDTNAATDIFFANVSFPAPNFAPTDLSLSATTINENVATNTVVGNFSSTDPDTGNTFTYSLASGTGSTDNASFSIINGNQLSINVSPDYETKSSYSIRIRTTDQGGLFYEKALTIGVNNLNDAPILVNNAAIPVNQGTAVTITSALLQTTDQDNTAAQLTYTLTNLPSAGTLKLSGNALAVGGKFTQDDINNSRVTYLQSGSSSTSDNFGFTVSDSTPSTLIPVSTNASGVQGNSYSFSPIISGNGRYVAFYSSASNLVSGDTNGVRDVFIKDLQTGTIVRASTSTSGSQSNGDSFFASLSTDGRYVAFYSKASNLVSGDTNNASDIFVKDLQTGILTRVSTASDGTQGNNGVLSPTGISGNGRYVAFASDASNLVSGYGSGNVFVKDLQTGAISLVSTNASGNIANNLSVFSSISKDGRYVSFWSYASNLVSGDTNGVSDVFVKDMQTGTITLVSTNASGDRANGYSGYSNVSADGRYVAFYSSASNLVSGDTNNAVDVFVKDLQTGTITLVSSNASGNLANGGSGTGTDSPGISSDGRYVSFSSSATNLDSNDTHSGFDVYIKDLQTGNITLVSPLAEVGGGQSYESSLSADGRYVAFDRGLGLLVRDLGVNSTTISGSSAIAITQTNSAPTNLTLSTSSLNENVPVNTIVGNFSTTDPDTGNTFTYSLVSGTGSTDNASFSIINGNQLSINASPDYETKSSYSIRVKTTDQGGLTFEKQLTIGIINVDEQRSLFLTPQQDIFINEGLDDTVTGTFANLQQNDNINGGAGIDTLILSGGTSTDELNIDASDTTNQLDIIGSTITNFERFDLSEFLGNVSIVGIDNSNNWLKTGSGKDDLTGGKGNDTLNGGTGADILIGLKGNDTYVVDNTGDIIIENLNSGIDTVESSISWTLKANLENLTLTGTSAINGTGNNLNNTIVGNSANNVINGTAGIDTLTGGAGNDTFVVDTVTDLIDGGVGTDTIQSSVNFSLANALVSNVENLTLTGTANIDGIGNGLVNTITGNAANNILDGGTGNDILSGGTGNDTLNGGIDKDTLTGGVGIDTFVFQFGQSLVSNSDRITDFAFGTDKIDLLTQTGLAINAPTNFSRAANSTATTLQNLVNSVFTDANGATTGNQALEVNSAALVQVTTAGIAGTYLVINDNTAGFQSNNDLLINITGYSGTLPALGAISVNSFFV